MTELQMGVRNISIELERFSVGVFGFREIPRLLKSVAVLNPYGRVVGLLVERLLVVLRRQHPVPRVTRPVRSGNAPRARSRDKVGSIPYRLQKASRPRRWRRWRGGIFGGTSTRSLAPAYCPAREKFLRCVEVFDEQYTRCRGFHFG